MAAYFRGMSHNGFISVLHTWGQNLMDHPHVHCIVPGGGLSFDNARARTRCVPSRKKFFIPVKFLSRKFRGKFLAFLKAAVRDGDLYFYGKIESLSGKPKFQALIDALYQKEWIAYCKKPFKSPWYVLRYLGRYTTGWQSQTNELSVLIMIRFPFNGAITRMIIELN